MSRSSLVPHPKVCGCHECVGGASLREVARKILDLYDCGNLTATERVEAVEAELTAHAHFDELRRALGPEKPQRDKGDWL